MNNKEFKEIKGQIYLGETKMTEEMSDILQAEALYLNNSKIMEVLNDTIEEECFRLSVIESTKWEDVMFSKALWHWKFVLNNLVHKLSTKNA